MNENVLFALILTLFAGLATGIGSAIALCAKRTDRKFLSFALRLSAGVMIYVSFMESLFTSRIELGAEFGNRTGTIITVAAFFIGVAVCAIIDKLVPAVENPHELHSVEDLAKPVGPKKLARMGFIY